VSFGRLSGAVIQAGVVLWMVSPSLPAAAPPVDVYSGEATITIVGRAGSFGTARPTVPSGQRLSTLEVPGWSFPAARKPAEAVLVGDGSLLMPAVSHNDSLTVPTSPEMAVVAYDPRFNTSEVIQLVSTPGVVGAKGMLVAPTVTGLAPLNDGIVAFTAWAEGIDTAPVFGLMSKVDGHWRSLPVNRWTARALGISRVRGLARMPVSGDLIIAQEGGALTTLRVSGPDLSGRYFVVVRSHFHHPDDVTVREVHADPTGQRGAERLVVAMDRPGSPAVIQEFIYNEANGVLTELSAPFVPGDINEWTTKPNGYQKSTYDRAGNLWAARQEGPHGGKLAVYTAARCKPQSGVWGRSCPPQYDIVQAAELSAPQALIEDATSGAVVLMTGDGVLMPVRARVSGNRLEYEVGNLVDVGGKLLTVGEGSTVDSRAGTVDHHGHLWFPASRAIHDSSGRTTTDHWMFAVTLADLFDPPPTRLAEVSGRRVTIQAENTTTISTRTTKTKAGVTEVHSNAHFSGCVDLPATGCTYDGIPGNGFYLRDDTKFGHFRGPLTYRVEVPVAGRYRLAYQVVTFEVTKNARIEMAIGGRRYTTAVSTNGDWRPMRSDMMVWFDAGLQTITIAPPEDGGGGWFLNSMTLQRV